MRIKNNLSKEQRNSFKDIEAIKQILVDKKIISSTELNNKLSSLKNEKKK